jgi:hypothetical protein
MDFSCASLCIACRYTATGNGTVYAGAFQLEARPLVRTWIPKVSVRARVRGGRGFLGNPRTERETATTARGFLSGRKERITYRKETGVPYVELRRGQGWEKGIMLILCLRQQAGHLP